MKKITDYNLENKKVIIRCDFNVPIQNGKIMDETRIKESLKTIKYAREKGAKIILLSHMGRVKEEKDKEKYTLKPVAESLSKKLRKKVIFVDQTRGEKVENAINKMKPKDVILLENTRFEDLNGELESNNDEALGKYWASLGDIFINDAFGTIHRSHASNVGIATYLKSGIGFLVEKELKELEKLNNPKRPYTIVLGGAKISDKIGLVNVLAEKADYLLIGGGMAFTFLKSAGFNIGMSVLDKDSLEFCAEMLKKYEDKIILPIDIIVSKDMKTKTERFINEIEEDETGLDIGPKTVKLFKQYLESSKTIFLNGPLGYFENENFQNGTKQICQIISENKGIKIVGGGDTASAVTSLGYAKKMTHISTGGGASLKFIEGKPLKALEIIKWKIKKVF